MSTFLFNEIIFGPVKSRRLGVSLGINLLPTYRKLCSFDCIYCECGFNPDKTAPKAELPTRIQVKEALQKMLTKMGADQNQPDVITFAGNGEPTLHPEFAGIIDDTIELRNQLCPGARVAVLSNATRIGSQTIFEALLKVDDNIQKLDSGLTTTIQLLDQPVGHFSLKKTVEQLKQFNGHVIIQTLFVKGSYKGQNIDNTQPKELTAWLQLINEIAPREVMVYTIARDTPVDTLEKIPENELNIIADKIKKLGIAVQVSA
jgi:wyosine [tRNA(Phe)-imidazoG37] synthetase (radical SAM superfamily)